MNKRLTKISKYMSFILRHQPDAIGLKLDSDGYLVVDEMIKKANENGKSITVEQLHQVVVENEDQIFEFSEDKLRIRAKQRPKRAKRRSGSQKTKPTNTKPTGSQSAKAPPAETQSAETQPAKSCSESTASESTASETTASESSNRESSRPKPAAKLTGAEIWAQRKPKR